MERQLELEDETLKLESVRGAMERAEKLPNVACESASGEERTEADWDHGDTWLGEWGKWENYEK